MIDWREYLTSDPQVCHGQLCAKGTRVLLTNILDLNDQIVILGNASVSTRLKRFDFSHWSD
jgi:hypothetical protein